MTKLSRKIITSIVIGYLQAINLQIWDIGSKLKSILDAFIRHLGDAIQQVKKWFVAFYVWLAEARWGLLLLCLIAGAIFFITYFPSQIVLKTTGLSLQLIGMALAIMTLLDLRL